MAVTRVPWVQRLTWGIVWAKPRKPAPTKLMMPQPTVQKRATRFGCRRPPRRIIVTA